MDHTPSVCTLPALELVRFCQDAGHKCRLEPQGSLLIPPDLSVGVTDWERAMWLRCELVVVSLVLPRADERQHRPEGQQHLCACPLSQCVPRLVAPGPAGKAGLPCWTASPSVARGPRAQLQATLPALLRICTTPRATCWLGTTRPAPQVRGGVVRCSLSWQPASADRHLKPCSACGSLVAQMTSVRASSACWRPCCRPPVPTAWTRCTGRRHLPLAAERACDIPRGHRLGTSVCAQCTAHLLMTICAGLLLPAPTDEFIQATARYPLPSSTSVFPARVAVFHAAGEKVCRFPGEQVW